jgi:hypothetical protein
MVSDEDIAQELEDLGNRDFTPRTRAAFKSWARHCDKAAKAQYREERAMKSYEN